MKTFLPSRLSFGRLLIVPGTLLLLASLSTRGTYARTLSDLSSPKYKPVSQLISQRAQKIMCDNSAVAGPATHQYRSTQSIMSGCTGQEWSAGWSCPSGFDVGFDAQLDLRFGPAAAQPAPCST